MALKKQFLKTDSSCKVSFRVPPEAAPDARAVFLVGDFNGWVENAEPMRKLKDGSFTATVKLATGRDYQFRYLVDGVEWINDWDADRYEYNEFANGENSVVCV